MIRLVPAWTEKYDEFWQAIKRRNVFFIKLRYIAVLMLIVFNYVSDKIISIQFTPFQHKIIGIITLFILIYNIIIHVGRKKLKNIPKRFNSLHLSLVQILLDLTALTLLVYFTGGIESPLYLFYIFHMIIGSLILPGWAIYIIAVITILIFATIAFLNYYQVLPHYAITGLYPYPIYTSSEIIVVMLVVFTVMMVTSVFLANRIAIQLYSQEKKLIDTLDEINENEVKKQKYIMGVVHEIKTPIVAVQSIIELLLNGILGEIPPKVLDKLARVKIRSKEALEMINNVLRISRLRLLNESDREEVNLVELVQKLLVSNQERIEAKKISINLNEQGESRHSVNCDKTLIEMALSNILSNSIKYSNLKGRIEIAFKYTNLFLDLSICDDGIGIPKKELKQIFKSFYRVVNSESGEYEGTGLGLSLVKEIVEQHQGEINVVSPSPFGNEEDPGTCFILKLPYTLKDADKMRRPKLSVKGGV